MNNDSKKKDLNPPSHRNKHQQKVLGEYMAEIAMPKIAAVIKDVAEGYAAEIGDDAIAPDPFDVDEAANKIIGQIVSFLWLCSPDFRDAPLLHFRQLTNEHFKSWWDVS